MDKEIKLSAQKSLNNYLGKLKSEISVDVFSSGIKLFENGNVQLLSQGRTFYELEVENGNGKPERVSLNIECQEDEYRFETKCSCRSKDFCKHGIAALYEVKETMASKEKMLNPTGRQYTREGMIKRVLDERRAKAFSEKYRLKLARNPFGEHLLKTEKSINYRLMFRDFDKEIGYCSCPDYKKNKLGVCKHLMFAFSEFKNNAKVDQNRFEYPFIDIHLDPLNEYRIAYFSPPRLSKEERTLIDNFFDADRLYKSDELTGFLNFIREAEQFDRMVIRPEVYDLVEEAFDDHIIEQISKTTSIDLSPIKVELFPYQKEGVEFAAYRKGAIIADEMGLGKTLQAISTAVVKKQLFDFKKVLVICPASLKSQWKSEIEKFTEEKAVIVEGFPEQRADIYQNDKSFFLIVNYETVLRDKDAIDKQAFDFIILDEAQKIKNYETITANAVKGLKKKHGLVITGTPIENKLIDLYSIVEFLYPKMLSPIWEFSYQYCYFDEKYKNKITGYTNLQELKERMSPVLLRRTKKEVIRQLHNISEITIPVSMHPKQRELHASYARGIASVLSKKFKTQFDWQKITMLLQSMRMVCNSTFLIDPETNFSPKLDELKDVLFEKLDLANNKRKVIIFSEWIKSNFLIANLLKENNIGYTELNGKVAVKKRQALIKEFEDNPHCRVFISTEAGGSGLNLQVADTIINFELPWNPAKKNQRTGRIDRLGQKNKELTVVSLITTDSIEMKIAAGLMAKQELFDNVLNNDSSTDVVDFSDKGRAQFLQELELSMKDFAEDDVSVTDVEEVQTSLFEEESSQTAASDKKEKNEERIQKLEELETVMNKGMEFLSGMFRMSTGKEMSSDNSRIEVDKETGEVVMRFKVDV